MNIQDDKPASILDPSFVYVPSDQTNIAATFAREIAKLRRERPYYESAFDEVEDEHHLMFIGGFER